MGPFPKTFHSRTVRKLKLTNGPITDGSYNESTKVVSACTTDGRVILASLRDDCAGEGVPPQVSTVQILIDSISKLVWTSSYEFVVVGSDQSLHCFSIMDLRSDVFQMHTGSIAALRKKDNLLYTGSADGNVGIWDLNSESIVGMIGHVHRSKLQPIKDLEVHSNYLYSSSIYKGRVWAWDLRNTKRCLNSVETQCCQNSLKFCQENLFCSGDTGVLRMSQCLRFSESLHRECAEQACPQSHIDYLERLRAIIWSRSNGMELKVLPLLDNDEERPCVPKCVLDMPGINGFELCGSDKVMVFNCSGEVVLERLEVRHGS